MAAGSRCHDESGYLGLYVGRTAGSRREGERNSLASHHASSASHWRNVSASSNVNSSLPGMMYLISRVG